MNYYKITYVGRNNMGANMRQDHTRIVEGMDEATAIQTLRRKDWGRTQDWPHTIELIENVELATEGEFGQQEAADELQVSHKAKQLEWNKQLVS